MLVTLKEGCKYRFGLIFFHKRNKIKGILILFPCFSYTMSNHFSKEDARWHNGRASDSRARGRGGGGGGEFDPHSGRS